MRRAPTAGEVWYSPAYIGPTELAVGAHRIGDGTMATQLCFLELATLDWQPPG